jgi:hypothetical protein
MLLNLNTLVSQSIRFFTAIIVDACERSMLRSSLMLYALLVRATVLSECGFPLDAVAIAFILHRKQGLCHPTL